MPISKFSNVVFMQIPLGTVIHDAAKELIEYCRKNPVSIITKWYDKEIFIEYSSPEIMGRELIDRWEKLFK